MSCYNPCSTCHQCPTQCTCSNNVGCLDIYNTSCITYDGLGLSCIGVDTNVNINDLLLAANTKICDLTQARGKVKVDEGDTVPKTLIDKLEAGANIILTGTGSGNNRKLRVDAILGGQAIDEKVKISSTDTTPGLLENKLIVGDCLSVQKVNTGLDEKLKVVIDWNCVLGKLSSLAGWCSTVQSCIGNLSTTCPSISLNSPSISGNDVTLTWVSAATQFNVYVDGILVPGMPTGSLNYTINDLADGTHTIQVSAVCSNGSSNSATTSVVINTTCPSASAIVPTIAAGSASVTWTAATGPSVVDQTFQYRIRGAASWTSVTLPASTSSHIVNGLSPNRIYEFRILTNCSVGGPTPSPLAYKAQLTCPAVTLTPSGTSIQYSFTNVGGDVNQYNVELLNNTGDSVLQNKTELAPFATTVTNTFTGLTQGTNYQVRVTVVAQEFQNVCSGQAISTSVPPSCPEPTGTSGTVN